MTECKGSGGENRESIYRKSLESMVYEFSSVLKKGNVAVGL